MIIVIPGGNGECSISYRPDLLSDEVKARGIELEELPMPEQHSGKHAVLMANKQTGEVWYDYRDIPPDPLEERVKMLEAEIDELKAEIDKLKEIK